MIPFHSTIDSRSQYRLLELSPHLLKAVENRSNLQIKSSHENGEVMLCTESRTFRLRQINQSNTLLLFNSSQDYRTKIPTLTTFGSAANFLEAIEIAGSLDLSTIPIYKGDGEISKKETSVSTTVESLRSQSPASDREFEALWVQNLGVEVNGVACLIDNELVMNILSDLLLTAVSTKMPLDNVDRDLILNNISIDENGPIVEQVFRRFTTLGDDQTALTYMFDVKTISKWFGLHILRKKAKSINLNIIDFLDQWKQSIPVNLGAELNVEDLVGYYVVPQPDTIRYFTADILSEKPKIRFQQLFSIKSTWEFDEIVPFIEGIRNKSVKMESFIMKFARKKTSGKRVIITAR